MTKVDADGRKEALSEFRAKYFHELENSLRVAIDIRDDTETSARDRNEANKFIARLLDAIAPDKITPDKNPNRAKEKKDGLEITDAEWQEIEKRLQ